MNINSISTVFVVHLKGRNDKRKTSYQKNHFFPDFKAKDMFSQGSIREVEPPGIWVRDLHIAIKAEFVKDTDKGEGVKVEVEGSQESLTSQSEKPAYPRFTEKGMGLVAKWVCVHVD